MILAELQQYVQNKIFRPRFVRKNESNEYVSSIMTIQTIDEAQLGHLHLEHLVPHHEEGGSEAGGEEDAEVHCEAEPVLDLERQVRARGLDSVAAAASDRGRELAVGGSLQQGAC